MSDQATCHCRPESKVDLHAVEVPCGDVADALNKAFSRAIHDAWQQGYEQAIRDRKPRTITTKQEVEALPDDSVIRDGAGDVAEKRGGVWCSYETSPMTDRQIAKYMPIDVLWEPQP